MRTRTTILVAVGLAAVSVTNAQALTGTYEGNNSYLNGHVTLVLNNGKARMTVTGGNGTRTESGSYNRNGVANFGSSSYIIQREKNGVRVTQRYRAQNTAWYQRISKDVKWEERKDQDVRERPPSWLVGWFGGHLRDDRVTLQVQSDGDAVAHFAPDGVTSNRYSGFYSNGYLHWGGSRWKVRQAKDGVRISETGSKYNGLTLHPISSNDDSVGHRPPSWMIGTFVGKRWNGTPMTLTVDREGPVWVMYGRDGRDDATRVKGNYSNGGIRIGNAWFTVTQYDWGIRIWQKGTQNKADLRRSD